MRKSAPVRTRAKSRKKSVHSSKAALLILFGVIAAISALVLAPWGARSSNRANASTNPDSAQKRYRATRPVVVDQQTGRLRMPEKQEIDEIVENLAALAKRPTEGLQQSSVESGGVAVDLDGGYGSVVLARPNSDGTWETKCVFTFEEGAEFLGIVEDNQAQ
jgi:hypothetical protein